MKIIEKTKVRDQYTIKVGELYLKEYKLRPEDFNSTIELSTSENYAKIFEFGTHEMDVEDNKRIKETMERLLTITKGTLIMTRTITNVEKTVKEVASFVDMNKE